MQSYDAAAIIRGDAPSKTLLSTFKDTEVFVGKRCLNVPEDPNHIEVGWAVSTKDASGNDQAFVAMTQDGQCAFIKGKLYAIDPNLVTFLGRYFSFLNYPDP